MNIRLNKTQLNNLFITELLDKFNNIGMKVFAGYFEVTSPDIAIETFLTNFRFTLNDLKTLISTDKYNTVSIYISDNMTLHLFIAPNIENVKQLNNYLKTHVEHDIKLNNIISYLDRYAFWYDTENDIAELLNINLEKLNLQITNTAKGKNYYDFTILKEGKELNYFTVFPFKLKEDIDMKVIWLNRIFRPLDLNLTIFNMKANKKEK